MRAMVLRRAHERLQMEERPDPAPGPGRFAVRVEACGVCRTDLHVVDGELPDPKLPIVPGHEIVGRVEAVGEGVGLNLASASAYPGSPTPTATCPYCRSGRENLCDPPLFTGYTRDGGFATHTIADADFVYPLSEDLDPVETAPLLCAGLIGWRSLEAGGRRADDRSLWLRRRRAHHRPGRPLAGAARVRLHAARRRGGQAFARSMGAEWAGGSMSSRPSRSTPPSCSRRSATSFPPRLPRCARAGGRLRRHSHERHPLLPVRLLWEERSSPRSPI